jgi:uncharacterized membrane protein YdbT with pleckstrin-like domain
MGYLDSLMGRNEQIVFMTRQHWLVLLVTGLIDGFLAIATLIIAFFLRSEVNDIFVALAVLAVFPITHFVVRFLNWYNAQYIVTNRRVMEIRGVINKRVSDSSLEKVNDVVLEQSILGRFLKYGTVEIITGSDIGVNFFRYIAYPVRFKTEMLNQKESLTEMDSYGARAKRVLTEEPPVGGDIPELIAELDELRKRGIISQQEFQEKKTDLLSRI